MLPPILHINEPSQVRDRLSESPAWPHIAQARLSIDWASQFFAPHAVVAAAWLNWTPASGVVRAERVLVAGNANQGAFGALFRAPGMAGPMLSYWLGLPAPLPVSLLSHQLPWPDHLPATLRAGDDALRLGRLSDTGLLEDVDRVVLLPSHDLPLDYAFVHTAGSLLQAHRRGVAVCGVAGSLTEAWLVRDLLRVFGLRASTPHPTHLCVYAPGSAVPTPAFYTWEVEGECKPECMAGYTRWTQLHAWLQDGADGYTDDALWVGTRDPEGDYVHLLGGHCLSLQDGYVYRPEAAAAGNDPSYTRIAGPVPRDLHSHPPQHETEPTARWYWSLGVMQAFDVEAAVA